MFACFYHLLIFKATVFEGGRAGWRFLSVFSIVIGKKYLNFARLDN